MILNRFANNLRIDVNFESEMLVQCLSLFNQCSKIVEEVGVFIDGKEDYNLDSGTILLDKLDEINMVKVNKIESFHINAMSGYQDLRRRLFDTFEAYSPLMGIINNNLDAFIPLDINELNEVHKLAKIVVGNLGIFILRQYEFEDAIAGGKMEFSLEMYLKNNNMDSDALVNMYNAIKTKVDTYRPTIEIFDEHPELEEAFMEKVGPWFYDINYMEYQDVLDVINEKLDPEDLKVKLNGGTDGDL